MEEMQNAGRSPSGAQGEPATATRTTVLESGVGIAHEAVVGAQLSVSPSGGRGRGRSRGGAAVWPVVFFSVAEVARWLAWDAAAVSRVLEDERGRVSFFPSACLVNGVWGIGMGDVMGFLGRAPRRLLTVGDVARLCGKPVRTVRRWIVVEGRMPHVVLPDGSVRVRFEDFTAWVVPAVKRGRPQGRVSFLHSGDFAKEVGR